LTAFVRHQAGAIASTLVDFTVMIACVSLARLPPAAGTAIGAACGGVTNFFLGRRWIFQKKDEGAHHQAARYALVSATSLILNTLGEHVLAGIEHVQYVIARMGVALAVSVLWNYPMQRSFVFRAAR
jgi:putative flippase GtrA